MAKKMRSESRGFLMGPFALGLCAAIIQSGTMQLLARW